MTIAARSALGIRRARRGAVARAAGRWLSFGGEEREVLDGDDGDGEVAAAVAGRDSLTSRNRTATRTPDRLRPAPQRHRILDHEEQPLAARPDEPQRRTGPYFRGVDHLKRSYLDALSSTAAARSSGSKQPQPPQPPPRQRNEPRWPPPPRTTHSSNGTQRTTYYSEERLPAAPSYAASKPAASSFSSPRHAQDRHAPAAPRASTKASSFTNPFQFSKRPVERHPQTVAASGPKQHAWRENESSMFAGDSSIFDVFRIREEDGGNSSSPAESRRNHQRTGAFDGGAFRQYTELLRRAVSKNDRLKKRHTSSPIPDDAVDPVWAWLESDRPAVAADFPSLQEAIRDGLSPLGPAPRSLSSSESSSSGDRDAALSERRGGDAFRAEAEIQREKIREALGWTQHQHQLAQNALFLMANACAKEILGPPVQVIWGKVKEAGIVNEKLLHVLLYVSAMFSSTGLLRSGDAAATSLRGTSSILDVLSAGGAATRDNDGSSEADGATRIEQLDEIALFHDLLYEPTEQTINIRARLLTAQGKVKEAEALLHAWTGKVDLRLRTYAPVLLLLLDQQDSDSALRLLKVMQNAPSVHLDAATYVNVLAGLARSGAFGPTASPIGSATALGYRSPCGPDLLNQIVEEMSHDVMEIPLASAKRLHNAFAEGFPDSGLPVERSLLPLTRAVRPAPRGSLAVSRVRVDPSTGQCPRTGVRLRLIHLTAPERLKLKETVVSMARSGQAKFEQESLSKSPKWKARKSVDQELLRFFDWLDQREGEPFTVVVDAANVAYYLQNFEEGRFSFHQIQFVVDALERLGERPLVILPNKYSLPSFHVTIGIGNARGPRKQVQTPEELEILQGLRQSGKLYVAPAGCLDDYFWIIASVSEQTAARKGVDLQVEPGDSLRWPGTRPVLVSNDQMRDHKLEMLEPMLFRRWYSNFIVNYSFSGFFGDTRTSAEIGFSPAKFYSREIQGNPDNSQSMVWHFPLEDAPHEWLCLRLPSNSDHRDSEGRPDGM